MNCEEARRLLDAYIDGELPEDEARALLDHAQACAVCGRELKAAEILRESLLHMDDELVVPLEAQAAWRSAVRAQARKRNTRRLLRMAYAAAAALVLAVGGFAALHSTLKEQPDQPMLLEIEAAGADTLLARDGGRQVAAADESEDYTVLKKISVEAVEEALEKFEMLAAEYDGVCVRSGDESCRIELPCAYMDDFLSAASRIGTEQFMEVADAQGETAVILIQFVNS